MHSFKDFGAQHDVDDFKGVRAVGPSYQLRRDGRGAREEDEG